MHIHVDGSVRILPEGVVSLEDLRPTLVGDWPGRIPRNPDPEKDQVNRDRIRDELFGVYIRGMAGQIKRDPDMKAALKKHFPDHDGSVKVVL